MHTHRFLLLGLLFAGSAVKAQTLGPAFTYQGELKESGQPATGLYDLQVCVFDSPSNPVPLVCASDFDDVPVENGVFTIALDFGLSSIFVGQQRFLELRVRPGASISGYTILSPRQLVRPAPEALRANVASAAPWSGLSGVPAGFADGSDNDSGGSVTSVVAGTGLSGGTITGSGTVGIANGGVGSAQLADGGVAAVDVAVDSLGSGQIASNAITAAELADNAVDTSAVQNLSITQAKIAAGAVGLAQINTTQVQARVSGSCASGDYFRGINIDGSLDCESLPVAHDRVLDALGDVGKDMALALRADNRPLIAYHDETNGNLKIYDCADAACSSGTRRILDSSGDVGEEIEIAIGPGDLPVIAYRNVTSQSLKLYACSNSACSSGVARTLDSTVDVGLYVAMALRSDGRPFIVYPDVTNFVFRVYDCDNIACSSGTSRLPTGASHIYGASVVFRADGRALIAMAGNAGAGTPVRTFECSDLACTTGVSRAFSTLTYTPSVSMVMRSNNRPLIAIGGIGYSLNVHDCADEVCVSSIATSFDSGLDDLVEMRLRADGRALIVFSKYLSGPATREMRVLDCNTASCSSGSSRGLVSNGNFGRYAALALRADGRPVIAYYDIDNEDVRLHICANPDCL